MGTRFSQQIRRILRQQTQVILIAALVFTSLACSLSGLAPAPTADPGISATQIALGVKATMLAQQEQQLALAATRIAAQPAPTAVPPTAIPPTAVPPTEPPPTAAPVEAQPTIPAVALSPTPDIEDQIKNAKILLYEDVAGYYNLTRWVREALDSYGFKYTDVGDAVGNFKAEILSGKKWDLVIAAAESRKGFQGELFDYLADVAQKDTAVIIETWYLESMAAGPISKITSKCGVRFQKNWMNPDRDSRSIVWLNPDHPLFHAPNEGFSLVHYAPYWTGDAGDMLQARSGGGDGEIVAGLYTTEKSRYGTLAVCYDGRVIIQTFSTHDYRKSDMIDLWQNMTYFTLKNHFEKKNE